LLAPVRRSVALAIDFAADRISLAHAVEFSAGALVASLWMFFSLTRRAARSVEEVA
jgi:hypothetical protein